MEYYVYVLRSTKYERNYVGFTKNLAKRLRQHNAGKNRSTKPFLPWVVLFFETFSSKEEALRREKFFKTGKGREYINNRPRGLPQAGRRNPPKADRLNTSPTKSGRI